VDEGIELLTGLPAGMRGPDGAYPADTVNGKVDRRLRELAEQGKENGGKKNGKEKAESEAEAVPSAPGEPKLPGEQPEPADS
jgi:Lon-like ATP-dependent protease